MCIGLLASFIHSAPMKTITKKSVKTSDRTGMSEREERETNREKKSLSISKTMELRRWQERGKVRWCGQNGSI